MGLFGRKGDPEKEREDPQTLMVEGQARYRTDVVGDEIVVVEVEDLG